MKNRTLEILSRAEAGGYGILAQVAYDAGMAKALVEALEAKRSPGMLLLFPVTLEHGRGPFLRYCLDLCHNATVPISVHLDHATDAEHIELALSLAEEGTVLDSIMIDASHADTDEENIAIAAPYIARAQDLGMATEVELGRLEGGEAGLREITGGMLTDPAKAVHFMKGTGADILAPSIGNLHGSYKYIAGGPQFRVEILNDLRARLDSDTLLCLHGTDELPDSLFQECIAAGVSKVNVNSWCRDAYVAAMKESLNDNVPYPDAMDNAERAFRAQAERFCDVLGSTGKAR